MYEKLKTKKKKNKFIKSIKPGTVVHSNDKYFQGSDGYSKDRESVVLASNKRGQIAVSKLTTSKNPNYKEVKNYNGSKYNPETIYNRTNSDERIVISSVEKIDDNNKFILSKFENVPIDSVEEIVRSSISHKKYGSRNKRRILEIINEDIDK